MAVQLNSSIIHLSVRALLAFLALASTANGITVYVDDNARPGGNGTSWLTAYKFLQDALTVAVPGTEIRIARGTYKPDRDAAHPQGSGDRNATFQLRNGVTLNGGYAGLGAPDPNARDIHLYLTILSGDLSGNDQPLFGNNQENSYHVLRANGVDATSVLVGATISGGNANVAGQNDPNGSGGGVLIDMASPTISECTFLANSALDAGGGIAIRYAASHPLIDDCSFTANRVTSALQYTGGGGIALRWGTTAEVKACRFEGNSAQWQGGAMYTNGANCLITNCDFIGNTSAFRAGAVHNYDDFGVPRFVACEFRSNTAYRAAGMYNEYCDAIVENCSFVDNIAKSNAGGMYNERGAPELSDITFIGNEAVMGGGMVNASADAELTHCTFAQNHAISGGGMWIAAGHMVLTDCVFSENSAEEGGGAYIFRGFYFPRMSATLNGCAFQNNVAVFAGGGMFNESVINTNLTGCTFSQNIAAFDGGGVYNLGGIPTFTKCTFQFNEAGAEYGSGGAVANFDDSNPNFTACYFLGNSAGEGGGISNFLNCSPTLHSCSFGSNMADHGGAMSNFIGCDAHLIQTDLYNNFAEEVGGAMWNRLSAPTLDNCTIFGNEAYTGGGLYNIASQLTAIGCLFEQNAGYVYGGAMYNEQSSNIDLDHCDFIANRISFQNGSVMFNDDSITGTLSHCTIAENAHAAVASDDATALSIHHCTFNHNVGLDASAIVGGSHLVEDCIFTNSQGEADVAYPSSTGMTFLRCAFSGNGLHADGSYGKFIFDSCTFTNGTPLNAGYSGQATLTNCALRHGYTAISNSSSQVKLIGCLIEDFDIGVSAGNGAVTTVENCILRNVDLGAQAAGTTSFINCLLMDMTKVVNLSNSFGSSFRLTNCTLFENTNSIQNAANSQQSCTVQNCILWESPLIGTIGNLTISYSNIEYGWPGVGNISADPMFVDPLGADGIPGTADDDLRLQSTSPCIDAANNLAVPAGITTDLIGAQRFFDMPDVPDTGNGTPPIVDMGAFEANLEIDRSIPGDVNGDDIVNVDDLLAVINSWGDCLPICPADIAPPPNGDGEVDVDDLLAVIHNWG